MGLKDDVNTGYTLEEYNERKKKFEEYKDTLPKEPSGSDVKKEYCVCCFQKNDWEFVHEELIKDGSTESNIPTEKCECVNDCNQSDVRGVHLLTDTEADELRNNPKVNYVTIKATKYPGTYKINPDDVSYESRVYRYSSTVKSQMDVVATSGGLVENYNSDKLNRCSSQLYRGTTKKNPWVTTGNAQDVIQDRTMYEDANIFAPNLHAMGLMSTRDFENYKSLFKSMNNFIPAPNLLIYLRSSVSNLVEQIQKRGRDYENSIRIDYLSRLNERYEAWISSYDQGHLLIIDVDGLDFQQNKEDLGSIIDKIDAEINGLF